MRDSYSSKQGKSVEVTGSICKLQQFIFASVANHYTLIDKRKEHSLTNRKEQASNQCSYIHFTSQSP